MSGAGSGPAYANGTTLRSPHPEVRRPQASLLVRRVFYVRDCLKLNIDNGVADLLHPADVDVLDDVASRRIDRDRAARTLPFHAFGGGNQGIAVGFAAGLLQGFVDEMHAVIAADGEEVRVALELGIECLDEVRIHFGLVIVVIMPRADTAEREVAQALD